jgi:hypothetical protein
VEFIFIVFERSLSFLQFLACSCSANFDLVDALWLMHWPDSGNTAMRAAFSKFRGTAYVREVRRLIKTSLSVSRRNFSRLLFNRPGVSGVVFVFFPQLCLPQFCIAVCSGSSAAHAGFFMVKYGKEALSAAPARRR